MRKYPVGIQTFERVIKEGFIYVDKTDLVWQLAHYATFVFMSRPRRFGKSLLTSTLESYFKGDRELFEGLKIMALEKEWTPYPVIHLDLSICKGKSSAQELQRALIFLLRRLDVYEDHAEEVTPGEKLDALIRRLYEKTGRQVAVIIDEYDAPLLDVLHNQETLDAMRKVMQEFYVPLKANEQYIKFCFITGITKFSQLSIFSTINNLANVSLEKEFSTICGFTEEELCTTLWPDVERMSAVLKITPEQMHDKLKQRYDGYHFAAEAPEVYNPFSLLNCFLHRRLNNYWFASGTPTFLIKQMQHFHTDITSLDSLDVPESAFDQPTENMKDALPLLYQSGYLTIKDYDPETEAYRLAIPNQEVRVGYIYGLLPTYTGLNSGDVQIGFAASREVLESTQAGRHRPCHAAHAVVSCRHTLCGGLQEEARRGQHQGGLLRIHVLPHLLHAQRLCPYAGEGGGRTRGHCHPHARRHLRDGAEGGRHGPPCPRPNQRPRLCHALPHRRPTGGESRHTFRCRQAHRGRVGSGREC